jgi:hypothetical protein
MPLVVDAETFAREFPGESDFVEFKSGTSGSQLQDTSVAFSNASGVSSSLESAMTASYAVAASMRERRMTSIKR